MNIKMLVTCENSHEYVETVDNKLVMKTDVRVFRAGEVYNGEGIPGDWERRCARLVDDLKYAERV